MYRRWEEAGPAVARAGAAGGRDAPPCAVGRGECVRLRFGDEAAPDDRQTIGGKDVSRGCAAGACAMVTAG